MIHINRRKLRASEREREKQTKDRRAQVCGHATSRAPRVSAHIHTYIICIAIPILYTRRWWAKIERRLAFYTGSIAAAGWRIARRDFRRGRKLSLAIFPLACVPAASARRCHVGSSYYVVYVKCNPFFPRDARAWRSGENGSLGKLSKECVYGPCRDVSRW